MQTFKPSSSSQSCQCVLGVNGITSLVRVAEYGLLLSASRSVSHPNWDGEGLFQGGAHHALRDLDGLCAVELKHLVAVVPVVSGQANGPVDGVAGSRQQLHSASAGTWMGTQTVIHYSIPKYLLHYGSACACGIMQVIGLCKLV